MAVFDYYMVSINTSYSFNFNDHDIEFIIKSKFIVQVIFIVILMLVGTLGNVSFLISVCSSPRLRNPANILLTNLAIGDLIYLFVAAPFYVEHALHPLWQHSELVCKLRHYAQLTAQGICVYSLTALSSERYLVLAGQTVMRGRRYRRALAAVLLWMVSLVISLPVLFLSNTKGRVCRAYPVDHSVSRIYECARFSVYFAVPLFAICCCYILIAYTLLTSTGHFRQESQPGVQHFRARKRLALIVIVIAIFFGIFWFPYHLIPLMNAFDPNFIADSDAYVVVYTLAALTNSALNPWIVYFMSSTHRAVFMEIFCRRHRTRPPLQPTTKPKPRSSYL